MSLIYETKNFIVESHDEPFVTRTDGGHIRIRIKDESLSDRTKLDPVTAIELMRLTMIVGEAMQAGMNKVGIPVVKINYQDMGNWAYKYGKQPFLHIHVFGRAKDSIKQPFPESVYLPDRDTGFYKGFEPLTDQDRSVILQEITRIVQEEKYQLSNWGLDS